MAKLIEIAKTWWTKHICADFPKCYPPDCFDCNLSDKECKDCEILKEFKEV